MSHVSGFRSLCLNVLGLESWGAQGPVEDDLPGRPLNYEGSFRAQGIEL